MVWFCRDLDDFGVYKQDYSVCKAVVGGTAGPAMAVPLFWPKMVLAGPFFWPVMIFLIFLRADFFG